MGKNVIECLNQMASLLKMLIPLSLEPKYSREVKEIYDQMKETEAEIMKHLFKVKIPAKQRIEIINFVDRIVDIAEDAKALTALKLPKWLKLEGEKVFLIKGEKLAGRTVDSLKEIAKCLGIKRKNRWMPARGVEKVRKGDILLMVGSREDETLLRDLNG